MQDQFTAQVEPITLTAACELGTHRCGGVVLSITDSHQHPCECPCHERARRQGGSS